MKNLLVLLALLTTLTTTHLHAQTLIDGKHWYRVTSDSGRVVIPANCVVTAIGVNYESKRSFPERIFIDQLSYSLNFDGGIQTFGFTGEIFSGDKSLDVYLGSSKGAPLNKGIMVVTYYN